MAQYLKAKIYKEKNTKKGRLRGQTEPLMKGISSMIISRDMEHISIFFFLYIKQIINKKCRWPDGSEYKG